MRGEGGRRERGKGRMERERERGEHNGGLMRRREGGGIVLKESKFSEDRAKVEARGNEREMAAEGERRHRRLRGRKRRSGFLKVARVRKVGGEGKGGLEQGMRERHCLAVW